MIPNKLYWYMGYQNLTLILDQERKHWLLKTDKKKQLQNIKTGDIHQGVIDNMGSDIILETEKLPINASAIATMVYADEVMSNILSINTSAFTHSAEVNGLMFSRITSINYPFNSNNTILSKHYKLKLVDCEECIIPFGGSMCTDAVFTGRWIKTNSSPRLLLEDDIGNYTIEKVINFASGVTNPTYYYPLVETLQPLEITNMGSNTYVSEAVTTESKIGYPLYWFCCDETDHGPFISITNNTNANGDQLVFVSNPGNASKYNAKLYFNVDGLENRATPDCSKSINYKIRCSVLTGYTFNGTDDDFDIPIDPTSIEMYAFTIDNHYPMGITCSSVNTVITMNKVDGWVKLSDTQYEIPMTVFDNNCLSVSSTAIVATFNVHLDENVSFNDTTTDVGFAGIRFSSANDTSDVYNQYPHDLNKWTGLPEWINSMEDGTPEHMAIYAVHNTSFYNPEIPDSRQVAAILLDPGKLKTTDDEELTNDERGRAYLLSNDGIEYENNSTSDNPKPARTIARICDVPSSVMQLSNIHGIAPTSIVDKKYVRSEASFSLSEKERLYNSLGDRCVKPTALMSNGDKANTLPGEDNDYVFNKLSTLQAVDMVNRNDFRKYINLNPMVDPQYVTMAGITVSGSNYNINDLGVVVVGGFAFHYTVNSVNEEGGVTALSIAPASDVFINISNFDLLDNNSGFTESYGTSPLTGLGSGLKFRFSISNYSSIITRKGDNYDDLYAFVHERDGLWIYKYVINTSIQTTPKPGVWTKTICVSVFEESATLKTQGALSTTESYMTSIIPRLKDIEVCTTTPHANPVLLKTISTNSMINIYDETKTPIINDTEDDNVTPIDICKFYCDGINTTTADTKNFNGVVKALTKLKVLRYDSYVFWSWDSMNDINNTKFTYGVIHRSFNNYISTDTSTTMTVNELNYDSYVHTNPNTTVVWDVDKVGMMMWAYNPKYRISEKYSINQETRELVVTRNKVTWADIDVRDSVTGGYDVKLVGSSGNMLYNIISNNPVQAASLDPAMISPDPIYQQPNFVEFTDIKAGMKNTDIPDIHQPMGNWQLVYPRVNSYTFKNEEDGRVYAPTKLEVIKNRNLTNNPTVIDRYGYNVNAKMLLLDEDSDGVIGRVYDTETGGWVVI